MKNAAIIVAVGDFVIGLVEQNGEHWEKMDPLRKLRINNAAAGMEVALMEILGEPDKKPNENKAQNYRAAISEIMCSTYETNEELYEKYERDRWK
ncbi:MAG: hypothetical protein AAB586_02355 [Patescibacteria group bacterium]